MTRGEAIKDFFCKTILPVAVAALLYCIFRSACVKNGELDYLCLQLPDAAADAVDAVLADTGKALHGVVPILRQGQHEG